MKKAKHSSTHTPKFDNKSNHKHETKQEKEVSRVKAIKAEIKEQKVEALKIVKIKTGKYRYFCDACTGIAFWADSPSKGLVRACPHCGKQLISKIENFILD
jgi:hypothetical protein